MVTSRRSEDSEERRGGSEDCHSLSSIRVDDDPEVCAVPSFISKDLGYKFDYLKAGFAKVVEQHLLRRKGVLVVEFAEAEAIAREAALGGKDRLERRTPLYFLGEYRN